MQNVGLSVGVSGLNESASVHALQDGEASVARNVTPDKGGRLRKRRGTRVLSQTDIASSSDTDPCELVTTTTNAGNSMLIERHLTDLRVYTVSDRSAQLLFTKLDVFNTTSSFAESNNTMVGVTLPGQDTRVALLTPRTRPVQLTFTERTRYESGPNVSPLVFNDVAEFAQAGPGSVVLLLNGVPVQGVSYTFNPLTNQATLTYPPIIGLGVQREHRFDLIYCSWQWWAESMQWFGSDFYQSTTRFNAAPGADINTPITRDLLTDLFPNQNDTVSQYPITGLGFPLRAMDNVDFNANTLNRDNTKQPVTPNRYWFGNGATYTPGAGLVETAPFNWTWGGLQPGGLPTRLYQHRFREIRMRNGAGVPASELRVQVNTVPFVQNTTDTPTFVPTADSYHLRRRGGQIITNTTDRADTISFTGTNPTGLSYNQRVEVIDVGVFPKSPASSDLGASAVDQRSFDWLPFDGGYYPVFGLHGVCNFDQRRFPTTGCLFQGRLILSGFVGNPLLCVASAVRDTRTPNNGSYNHFMVNDAFVEPSDAFLFDVPSEEGDAVQALTVWNETLVCMTSKAVYTSYAKGDNTFSASNAELAKVNSNGIINRKAYSTSSNLLVYVSSEGVESVGTNQNTEMAPLSEKVKGRFNLFGLPQYAPLVRVAYLEKTNAFYFFVPVEPCLRFNWEVLVLNIDTMGWTVYDSLFGFPTHDVVTCYGKDTGQQLVASATTKFPFVNNSNLGKGNRLLLLFEDDSRSTDYTVSTSIVGGVVQPAPLPVERRFVTHFFDGNNYILPTSFAKTGQVRGFDLTPYTNVCDVSVWAAGVPLQFTPGGVPAPGEFAKLPNGDVVLNLQSPLAGVLINMYLKQPATIYLD